MPDDPMVLHPPHYGAQRFGIECIEFARCMMFLPGSAFACVWRCEENGNPVQDLEKARTYWNWAWESGESLCRASHRNTLSMLYFRHLEPKVDTDWMAALLGDMIWENWDSAAEKIDARHEFFVLNGGRP